MRAAPQLSTRALLRNQRRYAQWRAGQRRGRTRASVHAASRSQSASEIPARAVLTGWRSGTRPT